MTAHQRILAKPGPVQTVLKMLCVKQALHDPAPDWEVYSETALQLWEQLVSEYERACSAAGESASEVRLAHAVLEIAHRQEVWGEILRAGMQ